MNSKEKTNRVLLVADSHWYLIWHLPRLIHATGAQLVLMAPRQQPFRRSRFVDLWIEIPSNPLFAANAIEIHLKNNDYDLIVFTDQTIVVALADKPQPIPGMSWLRPDVAHAIKSKTNFFSWALDQKIAMPPGCVCTTPDQAISWIEKHGPFMIKRNYMEGGFGVRRVSTASEVHTAWHELNKPTPFLIQKYIHGIVGVTELILQRGHTAAWFSSINKRSSSPYGASIIRQLINPKGMSDLVTSLAKATGFHGLCGFDWVQDKETGNLMLLEFHPRTSSGFGWGRYASIDVPATLNDLLHDIPTHTREPPPQEALARVPMCCYFPAHLWFSIKQKRTDLKYWLPGTQAISWRNIPIDDPLMLINFFGRVWDRLWTRRLST